MGKRLAQVYSLGLICKGLNEGEDLKTSMKKARLQVTKKGRGSGGVSQKKRKAS